MNGKSYVLVADRHADASCLSRNLGQEGFDTRAVSTGSELLERARSYPIPDAIVLEMSLPDVSGIDVCRELRHQEATRSIPIIFLTSRTAELDRVVAFEVGASDYVAKPYSLRELVLRIRARLSTRSGDKLDREKLRLDLLANRVWLHGVEVELTPTESRILNVLLLQPGRPRSRRQLRKDVWGREDEVDLRAVDAHIGRLRLKLGPLGVYFEAVHGVGYRCRGPT